jgi:hypothetical protein
MALFDLNTSLNTVPEDNYQVCLEDFELYP